MSTYTQIYVQVVFAVKGRNSFILPEWEEQLYKYITGIVQNKRQKMLAINGAANHIHFAEETGYLYEGWREYDVKPPVALPAGTSAGASALATP
jgi:hypothetical protein